MKHYLVTGGAGFIGSHLVRTLLEQGAAVRVLDNFSTGKMENLPRRGQGASPAGLEVLEGDVRDAAAVAKAVKGIDYVLHEAAFVSVPDSMERPDQCLDVNVGGTAVLFEASRKAGVKRVVIASSAAVYGDSTERPLNEETELRPLSPYAVSKRVAELYGELYTRSFDLQVTALRYFNVYGPRQNPDSVYAAAVPIFIRGLRDGKAVTIFGNGQQTRDLIFVGDVVRANLLAAEHPQVAGQVLNICTGQATSVLDLVEALRADFPGSRPPSFGPARAGDIFASVGDPSKAHTLMGFRAETHLADGLAATVQWMP